jgi:hypothetical protein
VCAPRRVTIPVDDFYLVADANLAGKQAPPKPATGVTVTQPILADHPHPVLKLQAAP